MPCVCIEVVYVCNFMCYVLRVELQVYFGLNCALEKLSIIIIIIIIINIISSHSVLDKGGYAALCTVFERLE